MATTPDNFEIERSRAAVAVACLEWLRCTGPTVPTNPVRATSADVASFLRNAPTIERPIPPLEPPHPLWDRWIDG